MLGATRAHLCLVAHGSGVGGLALCSARSGPHVGRPHPRLAPGSCTPPPPTPTPSTPPLSYATSQSRTSRPHLPTQCAAREVGHATGQPDLPDWPGRHRRHAQRDRQHSRHSVDIPQPAARHARRPAADARRSSWGPAAVGRQVAAGLLALWDKLARMAFCPPPASLLLPAPLSGAAATSHCPCLHLMTPCHPCRRAPAAARRGQQAAAAGCGAGPSQPAPGWQRDVPRHHQC